MGRLWDRLKAANTVLFVSAEQRVQERIDRLEAENATLLEDSSVAERERLIEIEQLLKAQHAKWAERLHYIMEVWEVDEDGRFDHELPGLVWPEQLDIYMEKYPQAWQKGE